VWPLIKADPVNTRELWIWAQRIRSARPPTATKTTTTSIINKAHQIPNIKPSKSLNPDIASSPSNMKSKIINHIRSGYPGLFLVSPEEQRVEAEMHQIAKDLYNQVHKVKSEFVGRRENRRR